MVPAGHRQPFRGRKMANAFTPMHRWFEEVWNQGREEAIDEMMADDCIAHGLVDKDGNELRGIAPYKAFFRGFQSDFANLRVDVLDAITDGERMAAHCLVTGKHLASGKPVTFTGMTFTRWRDGKIVEAWNNFDFHVMEKQLQ
jgi:predicted ester cyclase